MPTASSSGWREGRHRDKKGKDDLFFKGKAMNQISDEDRQRADIVFEETMGKVNLGFDPAVFKVLDDPEASEEAREGMKKQVSMDIVMRLMGLASSSYLGNISHGKAASFAATVLRLGTTYVKIFIISFALLALARDERSKNVLAKSFSTAIFGKLLAEQLNWNREAAQRVEICCLFAEIGKVLMYLYEKKTEESLPEDFIERCHWLLALKLADKFELPEYIAKSFTCIFEESSLCFTASALSVEGTIMVAYATVKHIYDREHRLVISSPMPDDKDVFAYTPGKVILNYLRSLGLSDDYLQISGVAGRGVAGRTKSSS
jgi:hypothetical protein